MRRRAAATLVAMVVAVGLAACGDGDATGSTDAEGRPLLPVTFAGGATGGAATAEATSDVAARTMPAGEAPIEYRVADGAEAPATEAPAYRFVPDSDGAKAKLSEALGGVDRGTVLEVRHGNWYFHRTDAAAGASVTDECRVLPDGSCEERPMPPPPPGVPSAEEAEAQLRRILRVLDVEVSSGRIISVDSGDPVYQRVVTFEPSVDGLPLRDLTTTIAFGQNGRIDFGNGFLGTLEKLGDYPLVGLTEAVERFQAGIVGGDARVSTGVAVPEPALDAPVASDGGGVSGSPGSAGQTEPGSRGSADAAVPPAPAGEEPPPVDPPAPVEPRIVEITGAELVLTAVYPRCEGDDLFLVPAFALQPDEVGFVVPAVQSTSVAEPSDSEAASEPCPGQPEPDEPVGRPEPAPMPPDAGGRSEPTESPRP